MIGIIGAGPAGVTAAEVLRAHSASEITIFSSEEVPPYNPAVLTTYLTTGGDEVFWKGRDVLERLGVEAKLGERVERLDAGGMRVITDKDEYEFEKIIVASGSRLYAPLKGLELPNVYNFKSFSQVERLRSELEGVKKAVVVGAGFQGTEISLALSEVGVEVTLIEATDRIMPDRLDKKASKFIEEAMEERGVELVFNKLGREFVGKGRCEAVLTEDGEEFRGDVFVAATGVTPNVDFCRGELEVSKGVIVNDFMETSRSNIYACGDVCESRNRISGERGVFANYVNAVRQARVAALNVLGYRVKYDGADVINSLKKLGFHFIVAGEVKGSYEEFQEGENYWRFYVRDGRLVGYIVVGDVSNAGLYYRLMTSGESVEKLKPLHGLRDSDLAILIASSRNSEGA